MISREAVLRLGSTVADDFGRSWSIGIWFVLSFAAVGYATQTSLGLSFQYAVLAAFLGAAAVASAKTLLVQRESHEDTEGRLFRQVTSDLVNVLREHSELLRKQQESSLTQVQLLASLNEHLAAASLSTPSSAGRELVAAIARVQAATEQSRDMSEHFMQHLIRIFSEGQQTLQKLSEQITTVLESVVQHSDSSASSPPEEQTEFTVVLTAAGTNKINVIKAVREVTSLGLKEAKDLVDSAPSAIKERINAEEAEAIKRKFVSSGASAEVKPS